MLTLVIGVLFGTALVGAPIAIRRGAVAASFGQSPNGRDLDRGSSFHQPVQLNCDGRKFGPGAIYEIVVIDGQLGIIIRRDFGGMTTVLGSYFYPRWWFHPSELRLSLHPARALWRAHDTAAVRIEYQHAGQSHVIEIMPTDRDSFITALERCGFSLS